MPVAFDSKSKFRITVLIASNKLGNLGLHFVGVPKAPRSLCGCPESASFRVNSDKDLEFARKAGKEKDLSWRSFWNGEKGTRGPISVEWDITSWPTLFLIDAKGVIRYKNVRRDELDEALTTLLAEAGHEVQIEHEEEADDKAKPDDE